jgi:cytochrome c biogenesis protein CcmG/thiol:disulfide interchange protein DsbE
MRSDAMFAFLLLLALALPAAADDLVVGRPAPPLQLHTLDGATLSTTELKGKVVILHFWATWCVPCREEMPLLSRYVDGHAADGLQVLGISIDNPGTLAEVKRMAATLDFPVGLLGGAWAGGYGRIWRLPVTFVIDRDGILRHDGWQDEQEPLTEASLDRIVTPLLGTR